MRDIKIGDNVVFVTDYFNFFKIGDKSVIIDIETSHEHTLFLVQNLETNIRKHVLGWRIQLGESNNHKSNKHPLTKIFI